MQPACAVAQAGPRPDDCALSADPQAPDETRRQSDTSRGNSPDGAFYKQACTGRAARCHLAESTRCREAAVHGLPNSKLYLLRRRTILQSIDERSLGAGYRHAVNGPEIFRPELPFDCVYSHARTRTHATLSSWDRDVDS